MTIQATAGLITAVGIVLMVGIYLFVLLRSGDEEEYAVVQPRAYVLRKNLFFALLIGFFVVPALTLRSMPYSPDTAGVTTIDVSAHQWYWVLSESTVPVDQPIVFRVSSADVNHGFGIYTPDNRVIAQVQAMPGYTSELAVEFDEPGSYTIMCLEYCGLVHANMMAVIEVVDSTVSQEEL